MKYIPLLLLGSMLAALAGLSGYQHAFASGSETVTVPGLAGNVASENTSTPTPSPTPEPTATPSPTPSPTAEPTATPSPTALPDSTSRSPSPGASWPTDQPLNEQEMDALLDASNFPASTHETVKDIAWCESSWNPNATSPGNARGLMQLRARFHQWRADLFGGDLYDPLTNMQAAHHLWEEQGWAPWTC